VHIEGRESGQKYWKGEWTEILVGAVARHAENSSEFLKHFNVWLFQLKTVYNLAKVVKRGRVENCCNMAIVCVMQILLFVQLSQ
jgi:hypothetical protein